MEPDSRDVRAAAVVDNGGHDRLDGSFRMVCHIHLDEATWLSADLRGSPLLVRG